jgi:hypothetical protein
LALENLPAGFWPETEHAGSWTVEAYLLANVIDAIRELTYVTAKVNGAKQARKPEPVWRPGQPIKSNGKTAWTDFGKALSLAASGVRRG